MSVLSQSCYELLGVPLGAEPETVVRAWRERREVLLERLEARPDPELEALVARLDEAFEILSHPQVSRRYRLYQGERVVGGQVLTPDDLMDPDRNIPVETTVDAVLRQVLYPPHWRAPQNDTEIEDIRSVAAEETMTDSIRWPLPEIPDADHRLLEGDLVEKLADRLELLRGVLLAVPGPDEAPIPMRSRSNSQRSRLDLASSEWCVDRAEALPADRPPTETKAEADGGETGDQDPTDSTRKGIRVCPPWVR